MSLIDNNAKQPRKNFDQNTLEELAQSIREYGVVQPIIVVKMVKDILSLLVKEDLELASLQERKQYQQ